MEVFRATVAADIACLGALRHSLTAWLEHAGVTEPPRSDVVLATHEAAANAIEHSGTRTPIGVQGDITDRTVSIEISDAGQWKPGGPPSDERGRGLALITALVTKLEVRKNELGTTLRLMQRL
jgi:anti-sigma regulatory factor (Ser/Thr protein kinase)